MKDLNLEKRKAEKKVERECAFSWSKSWASVSSCHGLAPFFFCFSSAPVWKARVLAVKMKRLTSHHFSALKGYILIALSCLKVCVDRVGELFSSFK